MNLVDSVIDEIALEGLDGITLEALWKRLASRYDEKLPLSQHFTEQIWNICLHVRDLSFYKLEKERDELVIYDRYAWADSALGIVSGTDDAPDDIYEHCPVDDWRNGTRGSCAAYYTRKNMDDIVKKMNVVEAEKTYGRKLVIVASQAARRNALIDKTACPTIDLSLMQYCFLERIGRSRHYGERTQGKSSLSALKEDPKTLFYRRKIMLHHKLVTKQTQYQKSCCPSLLHLPRFYVERKPKVVSLAAKVIDILKSRPNHMAEYGDIKKALKVETSIKKLLKTAFFQKVVRTDMMVPWRTVYPRALADEWHCKNNPAKEKTLRVVQLIDPKVDINDLWKEDLVNEDEEPYEMDVSRQQYCVPFMTQANAFFEASKEEGLSCSELGRKMGMTHLHARTIFRNFARLNVVASYMQDIGRQRVTKCVSRKFAGGSKMKKQLELEMSKMKKLTEAPQEKAGELENTRGSAERSGTLLKDEKNESIVKEPENAEVKDIVPSNRDDLRLFGAATKILRKYKLAGCKRSYRKTFCNVANVRICSGPEAKRSKVEDTRSIEEDSSSDAKLCTAEITEMSDLKEMYLVSPTAEQRDIVSMRDFASFDLKNVSNVTYRLLKRANIVMEAVKKHKVVDDMIKLLKMISEEEEREGYDVKIDKKSLIRLLQRLAKDNLVKNIKLTLSTGKKYKSMTFICHPSVDVNHTGIRSAVEQAKIKFCLTGTKAVKAVLQSDELGELPSETSEKVETVVSSANTRLPRKTLTSGLVRDPKAGVRYGYARKFVRLQTLHTYLFYIVYEHSGKPRESQKELIDLLRAKGLSIDEKLEKNMSDVYNTEVGWKMFVPPLPKWNGWPRGWAPIYDLLLSMPLSIFLRLYKVSYVIPELDEYINDPIKRHLLVKNTPARMRNILFMQRKYIFVMIEAATRLCYMGLLRFGPQKLREKDNVFVFLNRRTELMDTTSSAPDYHKVEAKIYPVVRYKFNGLKSVDEYWYKLWTICVNTRLGTRFVVQSKEIVLEDITKKNEMVEATQARTPDEAYAMDNGHVPGDRMGAAGLDSAFFAHLKRNWSTAAAHSPFHRLTGHGFPDGTRFEEKRDVFVSRMKSRPVRFVDLNDMQKKAKATVIADANDARKVQGKNSNGANEVKAACEKSKGPRVPPLTKGGKGNRERSYVRRVLPRLSQVRARVKYDEIDYSALQRMDKLRVGWDTREDNILLVCKVAMMYLCPQPRRQTIGFAAVRDVLRSYSLTSYNKTSRACQRRLLYMLKKPETHHSVNLGVEELKQDFYINRRYGEAVGNLKRDCRGSRRNEYTERLNLLFRDLVTHIAKKYYDITDIQASTLNFTLTTCEEFHLLHRVKYPKRVSSLQAFNDETTNDIHASTINSVIHSSMCCVKDRRSWAYQLFRIYQQYPEWLLRSAMAKIRADQMVAIKKNYALAIKKQANTCMPMSSSQYQLSAYYVQKFNTKLPYTVFKEAWDFFVQLARHYSESHANADTATRQALMNTSVNGGIIAAVHDYLNISGLNFDVEIPRHVIMFDPNLQKDDERYVRIARRYQDILRNLEHVNIEDILENEYTEEMRNDRAEQVTPVAPRSRPTSEEAARAVNERAATDSPSIKPKSPSMGTDGDTRRVRRAKKQEPREANTDTEAMESEHELNLDDEDCHDELDENHCEDDDLICFLDGTKVRLTREDVKNSGYEPSTENDLASSRENEGDEEDSASEKPRDNRVLNDFGAAGKNYLQDIVETSSTHKTITEHDLLRDHDDSRLDESQSGDTGQLERSSCRRTGETNDVRRYTRLAMLRMREELNDLASNDSHHAHEYFVLNMFKVFYSLRPPRNGRPVELATFQGLQLPKELLPLNRLEYSAVIDDLKRFAIFPKDTKAYETFREKLSNTDAFKLGLDAVYKFIGDKREVGASLSQLSIKFFSILGEQLYDILAALKQERMVLRSGVTNTRYIHQKYADPWLIQSYKIMRLQKEAQQSTPPGSLYVVSRTGNKNENERKRNERTDLVNSREGDECKKSNDAVSEDSEAAKMNQGKMQKSRTCLLPTKDIYRAAKQLDLDTAEEIRVVVRPWIRIDGALNRRVLDRMLGGVLAYCLVHPAVHLTKVQEKFSPAIQPFHTKELVEVLMRLQCLKMGCTRKPRVTLFSKSSFTRPVLSCVPERSEWSEEELIVEPTLDATLKFSMFLSNRTYAFDFLA